MRTSTTLKIAGSVAVLTFSCLLFLNTSHAGAEGGVSGGHGDDATSDGNHCYYEDKHGNLQPATDRDCNPN